MKYPVKKWANDLNRQFSKEGIQVANKLMKRSSTLLSLGKCKSNHQTTVRYQFTPTKMPVIKKADNKCCEDEGKRTRVCCWREYETAGVQKAVWSPRRRS